MNNLYINNEEDKMIIIKASVNEFFLEEEIQLISLVKSRFGLKEYTNVIWSLETYENVKLNNNIIKVRKNFKEEFLTVYCEDIETGLKYRRKFPIIFQEMKDKLIHFIKNDSDYEGYGYKWNLWSYSEQGYSEEINFSSKSDFGMCAFVKEDFIIARRKAFGDNFYNDWSEQTYSFKLSNKTKNYYIIHGVNKLLTDISEVVDYINPRIEVALMDEENKITAFLSKTPKEDVNFFIYLNGVLQENINYIMNKSIKMIEFYNINFKFEADDLIEIRADNTYLPCKVTLRNYLNKYNIEDNDFGVTFYKDNISFKIFSPTSYKCELCLYNNFYNKNKDADKVFLMNKDNIIGSYIINIPKEGNENKYYLYRFYFKDINLHGNVIDKITYAIDPYAKSIGINGEKGYLVDINNITNMPLGWKSYKRPDINKKNAIIYEVHLRDFTIDESSGISKNYRGKFLGFAEENTTINYKDQRYKTGLDHLEELGITHIHLMPIFDFGSVDERKSNRKENRNWGYDPKNFNAPEGSYSTEPYKPISRNIELREMIKKIHSKNIKVVMDVVYNHMQDTRNFDNIVPSYYFRTDYRGRFTNGSGCGNEIATERPMVRKYIIDSIKIWINDYHIDGFRFDLMELIDLDTIKEIVKEVKKIDESIIIYGEPWKGGYSPVKNGTTRGSQQNQNFSIFNDLFRDYIRGDNKPSLGFINGDPHNGPTAWNIIEGLKGSINILTKVPQESINYVDAHDNYTLWDQIEKSLNPSIENGKYRRFKEINPLDNELVRRNILGLSIILMSEGIPFIHGGTEMLRTKNGDHNSYRSSDNINSFYWKDKAKYIDVFNYIKGLIEIRKKYDFLKLESKEDIINNIDYSFLNADDKCGVIKLHYKNITRHEKGLEEFIIVFNATAIKDYDINKYIEPSKSGFWNILADDKLAGKDIITTVTNGNIPKLNSYSILIMYS